MKILVTGGSGKLGASLKEIFPNALFPKHRELDITKPNQVALYFKKNRPEIVIHTAALTDIRKCQTDQPKAWSVNVEGTINLLNACSEQKLFPYFIYISTACVFEGNSSFYNETDLPNPKNYYSLTKLISETLVENSKFTKWLIIRTNFVANKPWPYPKAFTDRFGTYLFSDDVAQGIKELIEANMTGVVHLTGNKRISMFKLAKMVSPNVKPITLKNYKGPALTIDMSLNSTRWKKYEAPQSSSRVSSSKSGAESLRSETAKGDKIGESSHF